MAVRRRAPLVALLAFSAFLLAHPAFASAPGCGQAVVEALLGAAKPPGATVNTIVPNGTVAPFYQWESNNGYCGEVSLMSAGLAAGQWMSQYNTRMICGGFFGPETNGAGTSLLQAGHPPGKRTDYNAELLLEHPGHGRTGPYDYDWAGRCAFNAGLSLAQYPATTGDHHPNTGMAGYRDFMGWIKSQVIAGHAVTLGVMLNRAAAGSDPQYDHIVDVIRIGTNHAPTDSRYYPDDVLYFDDHGVYTLKRSARGVWSFAANPAIPPGAGGDTRGCTPYIFGYRFDDLVKTRREENAPDAPAYAIVLPDATGVVRTVTGNAAPHGDGTTSVSGPHNAAFAIAGPIDPEGETLPVSLAILGTSTRVGGRWVANPPDENADPPTGFNYENPFIGAPTRRCGIGLCASNVQPAPMRMVLQATVSGLTPGVAYNLYEYDFPTETGAKTGFAAALPIPRRDFNAQRGRASAVTEFTASGPTYTAAPVTRSSHDIVVFRAVPASAP